MSEPQTEAGRALLDSPGWFAIHPDLRSSLRAAILAIEAEARDALRAELVAAVEGLPLGPYRVEGPFEQGGTAILWGKQGTPPDFTDGWAIPLVARGLPEVMQALAAVLALLQEQESLATRSLP